MTPSVDPFAPEAAERFGLPIGERALAARVREDADGRRVLAVFEEKATAPDGTTYYETRHALATPPLGFTIFDAEACSTVPQWADALPIEQGFRMFTIGAATSDGCGPSGFATAIRAIQCLDMTGAKLLLSYVDRMFPIDQGGDRADGRRSADRPHGDHELADADMGPRLARSDRHLR
ncbi:MAG: hypothetical protein V9G22_15790 [Ottowia sp.]